MAITTNQEELLGKFEIFNKKYRHVTDNIAKDADIKDLFTAIQNLLKEEDPGKFNNKLLKEIERFLDKLIDSASLIKSSTGIELGELQRLKRVVINTIEQENTLEILLSDLDQYFSQKDIRHNDAHRLERLEHFIKMWDFASAERSKKMGELDLNEFKFEKAKTEAPQVKVLGRDVGSYERKFVSQLNYEELHKFRKDERITSKVASIKQQESVLKAEIKQQSAIEARKIDDHIMGYFNDVETGKVKISAEEFSKRVDWINGLVKALTDPETGTWFDENICKLKFLEYKKNTEKTQFGVTSTFGKYIAAMEAEHISALTKGMQLKIWQGKANDILQKKDPSMKHKEGMPNKDQAIAEAKKIIETLKSELAEPLKLEQKDLAKFDTKSHEQKTEQLRKWFETPDTERRVPSQVGVFSAFSVSGETIVTPSMHQYGAEICKDQEVKDLYTETINALEELKTGVREARIAETQIQKHQGTSHGPQGKDQWKDTESTKKTY